MHGQFGDWIAAELNMSWSTAWRYMRLAEAAASDGNFVTLTNLPDVTATELYALTSPAVAASVRQQLIEQIATGRLPISHDIGREILRRIADPQRSHDLAVIPREGGRAEGDINGRDAAVEFVKLLKQIASPERLERFRELGVPPALGCGGC